MHFPYRYINTLNDLEEVVEKKCVQQFEKKLDKYSYEDEPHKCSSGPIYYNQVKQQGKYTHRLGLPTMEERRERDLIAVYRAMKKNRDDLFVLETRGHRKKLRKRCLRDIKKTYFSYRCIDTP